MNYELINKQLESLSMDVNDNISILSNASALLFDELSDVSWVGFYLYKDNYLALGPFQGKIACTKIPMNKGVCGTAAYQNETVLVENVHEFKGHIACDSRSNSEIVIPVNVNGVLFGVLDIDSTSLSRFTLEDKVGLEKIVKTLEQYLS